LHYIIFLSSQESRKRRWCRSLNPVASANSSKPLFLDWCPSLFGRFGKSKQLFSSCLKYSNYDFHSVYRNLDVLSNLGNQPPSKKWTIKQTNNLLDYYPKTHLTKTNSMKLKLPTIRNMNMTTEYDGLCTTIVFTGPDNTIT